MTTNKKSLIIENDKLHAENLLHKNHIKRLQDQNDTLRRDYEILLEAYMLSDVPEIGNLNPEQWKIMHQADQIVQAYHDHRKKVKEIVKILVEVEDHKELLERLAKHD